jgi:hypothetical protein
MADQMKLYRFSPIKDQEQLLEAIEYVASKATKLMFNLRGEIRTTSSLTIFSHYQDEYRILRDIMAGLGERESANNGERFVLKTPIQVHAMNLDVNGEVQKVTQTIKEVRIRLPDPYRMQVGCCDIDTTEVDFWYIEHTGSLGNFTKVIDRPDFRMIEYSNPDYDVLVYSIQPQS